MLINKKADEELRSDTSAEKIINAVMKWRDIVKDEYSSNQEMRYAKERLIEAVDDYELLLENGEMLYKS
tara:strand:+ start:948 stop:1154 length:207 start_codon:yes stop_codon:yes gene_type:complete